MNRWGARRIVVVALLALVGIVAVGAIVDLLRIRSDIESGRSRLDDLSIDDIRERGIDVIIGEAADDFAQASSIADSSPFLAVSTPIPVVGDQVTALRDMAGAAEALGVEADVTGQRIADALDAAGARPEARVEMLEVVAGELIRIEHVAASIDIGAGGTLLPPVRAARESLADALAEVPERLEPVKQQVAALRDLLSGPSDYLIMVGNNAEMRAGAAMPLQIGVATLERGDIDLSDFLPATTFLFAPNPTGEFNANIDEELRQTYPKWLIGKDFPETAVVPDFPRTAPIFSDIATDTQGWETEGVIHIDALALAELLEAVGPITVGGTEYSSETAPQLVLNQTYLDYADVPRALRRDAQSDLAQELFNAIEERDVDILDVVAALQRAAEGRHLMAWSRDPVLQELFGSLEIDGDVEPVDTLVSVQNTAANKLDWYIEPSVSVTAVAADEEHWRVTIETTVVHPDRDLTVRYIEGPYWEDGRHRTLVTTQVPASATDLTLSGDSPSEFGFDGTSWVIGKRFELPRGEQRVVTASYLLPRKIPAIRVLPSARVRPVPWTVNGIAFDDDVTTTIGFGPFVPPVRDLDWVRWAIAGVLVAAAGTTLLIRGSVRSEANAAGLARIDHATGGALILLGFVLVVAAGLTI